MASDSHPLRMNYPPMESATTSRATSLLSLLHAPFVPPSHRSISISILHSYSAVERWNGMFTKKINPLLNGRKYDKYFIGVCVRSSIDSFLKWLSVPNLVFSLWAYTYCFPLPLNFPGVFYQAGPGCSSGIPSSSLNSES